MQKLHFVAQGAALAKLMKVSIVCKWWCGFAVPCFWCGGAALFSGAAATARSREAFAGLSAVVCNRRAEAETSACHSAYAAVVLR